jgi:choline dehydrogenase-like flavoprotein
VACARGLIKNGAKVLLVDAGLRLEQDRADFVERLSKTEQNQWSGKDLSQLKEGSTASAKGIPLKLAYGSDFPYRESDLHLREDSAGVGLRASFARGGFSNVWGAAMLPYVDRDLAGWPLRAADLAEHYQEVLKFTGCSAKRDDLESLFPIHVAQASALRLSRQAAGLLATLERNRPALSSNGLYFGQARLAVRVEREAGKCGCIYCGLCMYGCAYGCIYNSSDTLAELSKDPNFSYQSDFIVTNVSETGSGAVVEGYHRVTREPLRIEADRVCLAAGVIPSAQILLRSQSLYDAPVFLKDSQYFLMPLLRFRSAGSARQEELQTLSQVFMEIIDQRISPYTVHLQVYSFNDLIGQAVSNAFGPLARPLGALARGLENRLLVVQGYLHSDHSSRIRLTLRGGPGPSADRVELRPDPNPHVKGTIGKVVRKLIRHAPELGAMPLPMMLQIAEPGRGFHCGGSFPMSIHPKKGETDCLGRPSGWNRVHLVDASVLPSIPATTITFSAMANAHRIGCAVARMPD